VVAFLLRNAIANKGRVAWLPALLLFHGALLAGQPDTLARQSQQAKELMATGKYEEALPIYRGLVKALPGNTGVLLNLALAEYMTGDDHAAIPHLETVLKAQPRLLPALVTLGSARLAIGQPDRAVGPLERALAAEPANSEARGMLAAALLGSNRALEAAAQYRKLGDGSPEDPRAWYGLGKSYEAIAAGAFDALQKADATSPYVSALVADTRVQRRQYRSAFFFYQEALKQRPGLHGIHAALAAVYKKTGHADWAAAEEAKENALPPADCKAHPAECQFVAGHDVQAITLPAGSKPSAEALFWQAKAANELALQAFFRLGQLPPSVESHRLQAEILRDQNQHLESVKEWQAAAAMAPRDSQLPREIAASYFMGLDYRSALDQAVKLLAGDPQSAQMNFIAGDSLLRLEDAEKAVPYLQAALRADPGLLPAAGSLGLALSRLGKNTEAVPYLERSLTLDDDGSLRYQLARAYQSSGLADKARATMEQYQEIVKRNQEQKDEVAREAQIVPPQQ